jgi:GTP-binding protein EngB required for normal cell division
LTVPFSDSSSEIVRRCSVKNDNNLKDSSLSQSKTLIALNVLLQTLNEARDLLQAIRADKAGHGEIARLFEQIRKDIDDANERAASETIRIGILGGRGSGKSKLANALMGKDLLPESAIIFCTSLPTTIRVSSVKEQTALVVESETKEHNYAERNISYEAMRERLSSLCKESENPGNCKKIASITIEIPQKILEGKEIVDVPGFARGNPLHQAFAERYAKHYCDVCLVLLNNPESVQIGKLEGLEALTRTFTDRVNSTIFIINKCDAASPKDLTHLRSLVEGQFDTRPVIFEVSAKNTLIGSGDQYQFVGLLGHLSYLTARRILVLVLAVLGRLIANFTSLIDLCNLGGEELAEFLRHIEGLRSRIDQRLKEFRDGLRANALVGNEAPRIDRDVLGMDLPPFGLRPNEYAEALVNRVLERSDRVEQAVQECQAKIYQSFTARFEEGLADIGKEVSDALKQFEEKFNVRSSVETPKVIDNYPRKQFNPSSIERLRPPPYRLWYEGKFPGVLTRDIKFWLSPVTVSVGFFSFQLRLPIGLPTGVKSEQEMFHEFQDTILPAAVTNLKDYIFNSLHEFVGYLDESYAGAINKYAEDWKKNLKDYSERVNAAKVITSKETVDQIRRFIDHLRQFQGTVSSLMN